MVNLVKKNKILAGLVVLLGLGLLVALGIVILSPTQGPIFVDYPAPQIGVAVDKTMAVVDVLPGSPAEKAGIARGDIFKKVGGADLTLASNPPGSIRTQISTVTFLKEGVMVTGDLPVVISRKGQSLNFVVKPVSPPFILPTGNQILPTALPASSDWIYL